MKKLQNSSAVMGANMGTTRARLPCRGCLQNCKNIAVCEGKLWRLGGKTDSNKIASMKLAGLKVKK